MCDGHVQGRAKIRYLAAVSLALVLGSAPVGAGCPSPEATLERLRELDLLGAYRTRELRLTPPWKLFEKAAAKPGEVAVDRSGRLGQAVVVAAVAIEDLWMGINDEDHYAEGGYVPVEVSRVIEGTPRGRERVLFQYFKRGGFGRWWIDAVEMNADLYESSGGVLWELLWWDLMDERAEGGPPEEFSDLGLAPIRESRGAWLMIPLGVECTLVEYVTRSNPGGFLSMAQWFASGHVMRENLQGVQNLAREHIPQPHPGVIFIRPDGSVIEGGAQSRQSR